MDNKIKEIQEELVCNYYSFVNSEQLDWLIDLLEHYNYNLIKPDIAFHYTSKIVREHDTEKILTRDEVAEINIQIKNEFEKENRCEIRIEEDMLNDKKMVVFIYMIKDVSLYNYYFHWIIKNE